MAFYFNELGMDILVIGGNGTIGRTVVDHLKKKHNVKIAGRSKGDYIVDIADSKSIKALFEKESGKDLSWFRETVRSTPRPER